MTRLDIPSPRHLFAWSPLAVLLMIGTALADPANTKVAKHLDHVSATTVNFAKELGMDFPSLISLGARIEEARIAPDPFALAVDARELAALETASGKTASIKSDDLLKEAVEMAKVRDQPEELKSIAALLGDSGRELAEQAEKTEKALAADDEANAHGEKAREIKGNLIVINHTKRKVVIVINFQAVGMVRPGSQASFPVHPMPRGEPTITVLNAHATDFTGYWQDMIDYPTDDYTWDITDDPSTGQ